MRPRAALLGFGLLATLTAQVRYEDIRKSPGNDWLTYAGDYQGKRHSPLKQINRTTPVRWCRSGSITWRARRSWKPRRWYTTA